MSDPRKSSPIPMRRNLLTMITSSFIVSDIAFKSLTHLEVTFVYVVKIVAQFHPFAYGCPVFQTPFIDEAIISPLIFLVVIN